MGAYQFKKTVPDAWILLMFFKNVMSRQHYSQRLQVGLPPSPFLMVSAPGFLNRIKTKRINVVLKNQIQSGSIYGEEGRKIEQREEGLQIVRKHFKCVQDE